MILVILRYFLLFVEVVTALLLIGVILLQKSKQHGPGLTFGGGVGESLFGAQVGNVLTRTTAVLATIFLVNTTALAYLGAGQRSGSVTDRIKTSTISITPPAPGAEQPASGSALPAGAIPPSAPVAPPDAPAPAPLVPMPATP